MNGWLIRSPREPGPGTWCSCHNPTPEPVASSHSSLPTSLVSLCPHFLVWRQGVGTAFSSSYDKNKTKHCRCFPLKTSHVKRNLICLLLPSKGEMSLHSLENLRYAVRFPASWLPTTQNSLFPLYSLLESNLLTRHNSSVTSSRKHLLPAPPPTYREFLPPFSASVFPCAPIKHFPMGA